MNRLLHKFCCLFCFVYCLNSNAQSSNVLVLSSASQYMTVADHADLDIAIGQNKTISCWVKTTSPVSNARILSKRVASSPGYEFFISGTGQVAANLNDATGNKGILTFSTGNVANGSWHHIALVVDATGINKSQLYIDGVLSVTGTNAITGTSDFSTTANLVIGATAALGNSFTGQFDNIRIWNKSMSAAEVTADMTTVISGPTTNLLGCWDFENISGTTVPDVSGNNHPGTLVGSPTILNLSVNMQIASASLVKTQLPVGMGDVNQRIIAVKVTTFGPNNPLSLSALNFTMNGTTNLADVTGIKVYYTGLSSLFNTTSLFATVTPASGTLVANGSQTLVEGDNYFFIAYNVAASATEGNLLDATCESVVANATTYTTTANTVAGNRVILLGNTLLFTPGDAGSASYRIPAIITAADGSLVTVTDKRWNGAGDLAAKIDPVVRRSTDNGKTWSAPVVIANFGAPTGAGDAAIVMDKTNGNLLCLLAANKGLFASTNADPIRLLVVRSTDNGATWGAPVDVSSQIYGPNPGWKGFFVASGQAHQLRDGKIVAAIAVREGSPEHLSNYMISSADHGVTWIASTGIAELDGDEAKIVELNNGNLMMSIRNAGTRRFNISTDKGLSWGTAYNQAAITDPNCDGDFIRYTSTLDGYDINRLLQTIPFAGNRTNVSVLMSTDEGTTWPTRKTIFSGASAYSSLTVLPDGTLGLYYENGESSTYQMYFVRFSLNWLTNGADTFVPSSLGVQSNILNEENLKLNVIATPNPAADLINVTIINSIGKIKIKLFNLLGQLISVVTLNSGETGTTLSLKNKGSGVYILQVSDDNTALSKKIVRK